MNKVILYVGKIGPDIDAPRTYDNVRSVNFNMIGKVVTIIQDDKITDIDVTDGTNPSLGYNAASDSYTLIFND